jgi:CheY-like chemotaxis protein
MDQINTLGWWQKLIIWNHTYFSREKNYSVTTCNNGRDAIDILKTIILTSYLDENMPGMSGLETLSEMKEKNQLFNDYDH